MNGMVQYPQQICFNTLYQYTGDYYQREQNDDSQQNIDDTTISQSTEEEYAIPHHSQGNGSQINDISRQNVSATQFQNTQDENPWYGKPENCSTQQVQNSEQHYTQEYWNNTFTCDTQYQDYCTEQQERHQMLAAAYDPSRDLSPNLPCQESSDSGSGCSTSSISSACCKSEFTPCRECSPEPSRAGTKEEVVCAGCHLRITDRFYLFAVDRRWHATCLQCSQCRLSLEGEVTCFSKDGIIFCKKDYYRLFGMKRCGRCQATISSTELVMRARDQVFHVHCFTCAACSSLLTKGDTFGMRDGAVFCRLHYSELPPLSPYPPPQEGPFPHEFHHPRLTPPITPQGGQPQESQVKMPNAFFPNGTPAPRQKGRPRKRKPKDLEGMTANLDLNSESYLDVAFGPGTPGLPGANGSHHTRTKRMRTSFKHHQLRTMKSYFAINHNPDAKDLKQLSQKTSLPKRVLQVWFQNARAKWRRMVLKQEGGNGKEKLSDGSGGLEAYHHGLGPHGSPYLSPSPLECSS